MRRRYQIISAALALTLGFALCACGEGEKPQQGGGIGELTEHKGKITIWWPGSTMEMQAIEQAKSDYIAEYPDVTIDIIGQSTPDFYTAYSLACTGPSAPDIAYVDHVYVQTLAYYNYIADLSAFKDLKDTFSENLWNPGLYEGKLYGLPMSANVLVTAYNKTLIARAQGVTVDNISLPKNYEEFVSLCQKICALNDDTTKNDPYYGITIPAGTGNHDSMAAMTYLSFVNRAGGDGILSADLKTSKLNSEACVDAATKIYELGDYAPGSFSEAKFESGKIGFIEMGPWKINDYSSYSKNYGWEVGYTTAIPFTEGGPAGSTIGLYDLVVTRNKNTALAADFVKFVTTNDKYQLAFATPQNLIPTTKTAVQNEFYAGETWQTFVKQLEQVVVRPGSPAWTDIEQTLGSFVTGLLQHTAPEKKEDVRQECNGIHGSISEALEEIYS